MSKILIREEKIEFPDWELVQESWQGSEFNICQFLKGALIWSFRKVCFAHEERLLIQVLKVGDARSNTVIDYIATKENYITACDIVEKVWEGK